jgi:rhamnosyltransferase
MEKISNNDYRDSDHSDRLRDEKRKFLYSYNICAVIITYQPDIAFINRVKNIIGQFEHAVIVDNASHDDSLLMLKTFSHQNIHKIFNDSNLGISKALNQGIFWAKENKYEFVITFDQDSEILESRTNILFDTWNSLDNSKVAVLGVNHIDANSHEIYFKTKSKKKVFAVRKTVITSGSLINIGTFYKVGIFREEFFIDGVDHEFCLRARSKGFEVLMILEPLLIHPMGKRKIYHLPICKKLYLVSTNYDPQRWYYMTRNRIRLVMEYFFKDTWAISKAANFIGSVALMIIFEKSRLKKIKYMFLGLWDSLTENYNRKLL